MALNTASGDFLRLEGVQVAFPGAVALNGVDLRVGAFEQVAIVGASGAGKSTLLSLIHGAVRPTAGHVHVFGNDLMSLSRGELRSLRATLGFVHQGFHLVPNLRVIQNVLVGRIGSSSTLGTLRSFVWPHKREVSRAYEILERVGIAEKLYERTDRLSGGQRQRVAIARALFQRPRALVADEPVSSVDPARARDTVSLLTSLAKEEGIPLVVSLHNQVLAKAYFPRLVGLREGRVTFDRLANTVSDHDFHSLYAMSSNGQSQTRSDAVP